MEKPKYETCIHKPEVGQIAVYVGTGCKMATKIKGNLVSSKKRCEECKDWRAEQS